MRPGKVVERRPLISLQDAVEALYQLVQEVAFVERFPPDIDEHQPVNPVVAEPLPYRTAAAQVDKLRVRLLDDGLKEHIDALLFAAGNVMVAKTRDAVEHRWDDLEELVVEANKEIGEQVRRLFRL